MMMNIVSMRLRLYPVYQSRRRWRSTVRRWMLKAARLSAKTRSSSLRVEARTLTGAASTMLEWSVWPDMAPLQSISWTHCRTGHQVLQYCRRWTGPGGGTTCSNILDNICCLLYWRNNIQPWLVLIELLFQLFLFHQWFRLCLGGWRRMGRERQEFLTSRLINLSVTRIWWRCRRSVMKLSGKHWQWQWPPTMLGIQNLRRPTPEVCPVTTVDQCVWWPYQVWTPTCAVAHTCPTPVNCRWFTSWG